MLKKNMDYILHDRRNRFNVIEREKKQTEDFEISALMQRNRECSREREFLSVLECTAKKCKFSFIQKSITISIGHIDHFFDISFG